MMTRNSFLAMALLGVLVGCQPATNRPKTYPTKVAVFYRGQPVSGADVLFSPQAPGGKAAAGLTGPDGQVTLTTFTDADGAVAGGYRVAITKTEMVPNTSLQLPDPKDEAAHVDAMERLAREGRSPYLLKRHLPEKYGDFTKNGLTVEVKAQGENLFTFQLTDDK